MLIELTEHKKHMKEHKKEKKQLQDELMVLQQTIREHQLQSKIDISPFLGSIFQWRHKNGWRFSSSVGGVMLCMVKWRKSK